MRDRSSHEACNRVHWRPGEFSLSHRPETKASGPSRERISPTELAPPESRRTGQHECAVPVLAVDPAFHSQRKLRSELCLIDECGELSLIDKKRGRPLSGCKDCRITQVDGGSNLTLVGENRADRRLSRSAGPFENDDGHRPEKPVETVCEATIEKLGHGNRLAQNDR